MFNTIVSLATMYQEGQSVPVKTKTETNRKCKVIRVQPASEITPMPTVMVRCEETGKVGIAYDQSSTADAVNGMLFCAEFYSF